MYTKENYEKDLGFIEKMDHLVSRRIEFIAYFFAFAVTVMYSKRYALLPFDYRSIAKIVIASAVMGVFVMIANPYGILNMVIVIAVAVVIYFIVLFLLRGIDKKEINLIKGMI